MTTPNYSGFLSNFFSTTGTSGNYTDILSTIIVNIGTTQTDPDGTGVVSNQGCYFYLGNLLIQFSNGTTGSRNAGTGYYQYYPIPFNTIPYVVLLSATSPNSSTICTLLDNTTDYFHFKIGNSDGNIMYIAIGER
jgi:hypothetical protein